MPPGSVVAPSSMISDRFDRSSLCLTASELATQKPLALEMRGAMIDPVLGNLLVGSQHLCGRPIVFIF